MKPHWNGYHLETVLCCKTNEYFSEAFSGDVNLYVRRIFYGLSWRPKSSDEPKPWQNKYLIYECDIGLNDRLIHGPRSRYRSPLDLFCFVKISRQILFLFSTNAKLFENDTPQTKLRVFSFSRWRNDYNIYRNKYAFYPLSQIVEIRVKISPRYFEQQRVKSPCPANYPAIIGSKMTLFLVVCAVKNTANNDFQWRHTCKFPATSPRW